MSIPIKHHYLPVFFMERWANNEGKVAEFRRPHEALVVKQKHPAATGYLRELYANENKTDPVERQALEMVFMQKVDNLAAEALAHLEEHGTKPASAELRSAWSRFLMSLMHRSPDRVKWLTDKVREYEQGILNPGIATDYATIRGPHDPPTYAEWLERTGPLTPDLLVRLLRLLIDSQLIGDTLNGMRWTVLPVPGKFGFLTGDIPVLISNGLGHRRAFVMLAIGPSLLFIAANDIQVIKSFESQSANALQRSLSDACVRQCQHVIVAHRESYAPFVDRRFRKGGNLEIGRGGLATWNAPLIDL